MATDPSPTTANLQRAFAPVKRTWGELSPRRRATVSLCVLACVAALGFGVHQSTQQDMGLLYGGLQLEEAGRISAALRERGVSFEVQGGRVLVPADQVSQLRVDLAMQGLPKGGVGYELFDEQSPFGLSEFSERIAFQRARSGELARSIMALEQVERAVVHIVEPEQSVFLDSEDPPRASVVLRLRPSSRLGTAQVEGIARIVAGAVSGLALEDVSIVDERGNPLGSASGGPARNLELQEGIEGQLTRKAQDVLLAVAGPTGAVVQISAELDMDRVEETSESYDPDGRVVRHENLTTRERTGPKAESGSTGAAANVSGDTRAKGSPSSELEETSEAEYAVPRTVQTVTRSAGTVKRLSVALLVDEEYAERLPEMERLVKRAIGFVPERDSFESVATALDPGELEVPEPFITSATVTRAVETGVSILAILALILLAKSLRPPRPGEDPNDPIETERRLRAQMKREEQERQAKVLEHEMRERERQELLLSVQNLVAQHPRVATEVLRRWLYHDESGEGEDV